MDKEIGNTMNTAMTTTLGSAPSDSAMVHAIGHKILLLP